MTYYTCVLCGWTGEDCDAKSSWPVTAVTVEEPYPVCPDCGSGDLEDAELCEGCGLPVDWCDCEDRE